MTAKKTTTRKVAKSTKPAAKRPAKKPTAKPTAAAAWAPKRPALMLRTCKVGMTGYGGFVWPKAGLISAPDWKPRAECGNGLHGLLNGEGRGELLEADAAAHWLVVEIDLDEVVELDGKVKVPRGNVVHCGDQRSATEYLAANGCAGRAIAYGVAAAGDGGTATAGYYGTATAGDGGTATAGYYGTATAGDGGSIAFRHWDPKSERYRIVSADVGDDGIEAGVAYVVDETTRKLRRKEVAT